MTYDPEAQKALLSLVRDHTYGADPETEDLGEESVSVHFFTVRLNAGSDLEAPELIAAIHAYEDGEFANITTERWRNGPSYIEIGAWLGTQQDALQLIGLGKILGLWDIFTPELLGIKGDDANAMAGSGYVTVLPKSSPFFGDLS